MSSTNVKSCDVILSDFTRSSVSGYFKTQTLHRMPPASENAVSQSEDGSSPQHPSPSQNSSRDYVSKEDLLKASLDH